MFEIIGTFKYAHVHFAEELCCSFHEYLRWRTTKNEAHLSGCWTENLKKKPDPLEWLQ